MNNTVLNLSEEKIQELEMKYEIINLLINKKISAVDAAKILNLSTNHMYALKKKFVDGDTLCFINKKLGKKIKSKITKEIQNDIVRQYEIYCKQLLLNPVIVKGRPKKWFDSPTFSLFHDMIKKEFKISYSSTTTVLNKFDKFSPKSRTAKTFSERVKISEKNLEMLPGEEIQADGKVGIQFSNDENTCVAHVVVDASSNVILSIVFDKEETTFGYQKAFKKVFKKYGLPKLIVTDNRATFTNNKKEIEDKNVVLARGFKRYGIELLTTSSATRKGKVESKNDTLQNRILQLLALKGVKTMEDANQHIDSIVESVNAMLGNEIGDQHAFRKCTEYDNYEENFAKEYERSANKYSFIQIENIEYFVVNKTNNIVPLVTSKKYLIIDDMNGIKKIKVDGNMQRLVRCTRENYKKFKVKILSEKQITCTVEKYNFVLHTKDYHLIDNLGNEVKIPANSNLIVSFSTENFIPIHGKIRGQKYAVKSGKYVEKTVNKAVYDVQVNFNYNFTFTKNKETYVITDGGKQVVFPLNQKITITMEGDEPSYMLYKKKMLYFRNISLCKAETIIPRSNYEANKLLENNIKEIIIV